MQQEKITERAAPLLSNQSTHPASNFFPSPALHPSLSPLLLLLSFPPSLPSFLFCEGSCKYGDKLYLDFISSQSLIMLLLPPFGMYLLMAGNDHS